MCWSNPALRPAGSAFNPCRSRPVQQTSGYERSLRRSVHTGQSCCASTSSSLTPPAIDSFAFISTDKNLKRTRTSQQDGLLHVSGLSQAVHQLHVGEERLVPERQTEPVGAPEQLQPQEERRHRPEEEPPRQPESPGLLAEGLPGGTEEGEVRKHHDAGMFTLSSPPQSQE